MTLPWPPSAMAPHPPSSQSDRHRLNDRSVGKTVKWGVSQDRQHPLWSRHHLCLSLATDHRKSRQ